MLLLKKTRLLVIGGELERIDLEKLPRHIAIIMDGNGRWAKKHALGRVSGHKKGADAVRAVVKTCREMGIRYLTLYAFSVENWMRPAEEVSALMRLLHEYLRSQLAKMMTQDIRLLTIGRTDMLNEPIKGALKEAIDKTAPNRSMTLTIALSYGGQDEIIDAAKAIAEDFGKGRISADDITKERFAQYLYTAGIPDPDLLIRTSGEFRISNFLLWQTAYTELYFTDVLWPEFRKPHLMKAIAEYQRRERRFGRTSEQLRD